MRKTLVVLLCSALIAASSNQADAAQRHYVRKSSHQSGAVADQRRNAFGEQPRDSNVSGTCGLFPGPCQ